MAGTNKGRAWAFVRANIENAVVLIAEIILAAKWGMDTYGLAIAEGALPHEALLDVAALDVMFAGLLSVTKFLGAGQKARQTRAIAFGGAVYMYLRMLGLANELGAVAQTARAGGIVLLVYVGGDLIVDWFKVVRDNLRKRQNVPVAERLRRKRERALTGAYGGALLFARVTFLWAPAFLAVVQHVFREGATLWDYVSTPDNVPTYAAPGSAGPSANGGSGGLGVTYAWQPGEPVRCLTSGCGYVSKRSDYPDATSAGNAYARHAAGQRHRAATFAATVNADPDLIVAEVD